MLSFLPEDSEKEVKDYVSKLEQPFLLLPVKQIEDLGDIYQVLSFRVTEQNRNRMDINQDIGATRLRIVVKRRRKNRLTVGSCSRGRGDIEVP